MSRAERKMRAAVRQAKAQQRAMDKGAKLLGDALKYAQSSERRVDFWRNLLCASAFARGLGNERPIIDVVQECQPALLGGAS